jgi:hypothetical protein
MLSPSPFMLSDTVTIFSALPQQDAGGGPQFPHAPTPKFSGTACSVQYVSTEEDESLGRVSLVNWYKIVFDFNPKCNPRDTVTWDDGEAVRILIVAANPPSEGGKRGAWIVRAREYL